LRVLRGELNWIKVDEKRALQNGRNEFFFPQTGLGEERTRKKLT